MYSKRQKTTRITPIPVRAPMNSSNYSRIRKIVGVEKKYLDTIETSTVISATTGTISGAVLNIAEGSSDVTRVGNKITVTNVNVRIHFNVADMTTAAFQNRNVRFILYIDRQANGSAPQPTEIISIPGGISEKSYRNLDNLDRFVILRDKFIHLPMISTNALHTLTGPSPVYTFNKKVECAVHYNGATGALTELRSNNIAFLLVPDVPVTAQAISFTSLTRIKYIDS